MLSLCLQVVLALVLTAASAATVYHAAVPFHGLPFAGLPYTGLPFAGVPYAAAPGLTYAAAAPALTYAAAPALVAPAPYSVQTGVKTEVAVEPVEQHGYVVKY